MAVLTIDFKGRAIELSLRVAIYELRKSTLRLIVVKLIYLAVTSDFLQLLGDLETGP